MMLPGQRKPRLRVNVDDVEIPAAHRSSNDISHTKRSGINISVFRAYQMQLHVHSPSVKVMRRRGFEPSRTVAVFGEHDTIHGVVLLDPQLCTSPGRLTVMLEGTFLYVSPSMAAHEGTTFGSPTDEYQHRFLYSSVTFPTGETQSPRSVTSIREAISNTVRPRRVDRRPSLPELASSAPTQFPFSFDIPEPTRQREELPQSCSTLSVAENGIRGRTCVERAEIEYRIVATWEGPDPKEWRQLEAPLLIHPETDFQSLDGFASEPTSWLEIPLRADRTIPFKCAVTLPDPATFSRSASIPFFVVFTTRPRSSLLSREIAADATITISLIRQIHVYWSLPSFHSPTSSCSSSGDESDAPTPKRRLLHRVVKSAPPVSNGSNPFPYSGHGRYTLRDKPLPPIPAGKQGISDTRTLQTDVWVGFPKRPRNRVQPEGRHPSLDAQSSLPDGLYKGKMQLNKNMLPTIEWRGLSVKYFLDVSVVFGQDELRVRVPVRVV